MPTIDFTRQFRNCERREENTIAGEFDTVNGDILAAGDVAVVAAIPGNSVLVGITVVGLNLEAATIVTPTIGGTAYPAVTLAAGNSVGTSAVASPALATVSVPVQFTTDVAISSGRIVILPRFIEFDLTTGNRVKPADETAVFAIAQ